MDISAPNENGCLAVGSAEVVAKVGRSYAQVNIASGEDGRFRYSVYLMYSNGGFGGPIRSDGAGYPNIHAAKNAGTEELLRRWPRPFPTDPASVHDELRIMRQQIERRSAQPSLF